MDWQVTVLAAGRGPNDPLARAFEVSHKCLIPICGVPMLARVVSTLRSHARITRIAIAIENEAIARQALGGNMAGIEIIESKSSAAASTAHALAMGEAGYPHLITTADHALLSHAMLDHFLAETEKLACDLTVGLASAETILSAYPDVKRTFLTLGSDKVSGCNLYGMKTPKAQNAVSFWHKVEQDRKKPWRLIRHFGMGALLRYLTGSLTLETAFTHGSKILGADARPVLMPFAEAATDVDKPSDKELVEAILKQRDC